MSDGTTSVNRLAARPTTYNGVEMRSRLEARYAAWLDKNRLSWSYEPRAFAGAAGQYLPDFQLEGVIILGAPQTVYVDVKPTDQDVTLGLVGRMSVIWDSDPIAWLAVEVPGSNPILITPPAFGHTMKGRYVWAPTAPDMAMGLHPYQRPSWWSH